MVVAENGEFAAYFPVLMRWRASGTEVVCDNQNGSCHHESILPAFFSLPASRWCRRMFLGQHRGHNRRRAGRAGQRLSPNSSQPGACPEVRGLYHRRSPQRIRPTAGKPPLRAGALHRRRLWCGAGSGRRSFCGVCPDWVLIGHRCGGLSALAAQSLCGRGSVGLDVWHQAGVGQTGTESPHRSSWRRGSPVHRPVR